VRILVLSDTHIPRAAADMPKRVYDEIETCDMIFHAGDFVEKSLLDKLSALRETKAVYGNMDSGKLKEMLNPKEVIDVGRFSIGLIHGYGAPGELIETVASEFSSVNAIVFGHSHAATSIVKNGVLFFNPGSPTDRIFAAYNSYGILEVSEKKVEGKIIRL
jgi:putative phosphoesterase